MGTRRVYTAEIYKGLRIFTRQRTRYDMLSGLEEEIVRDAPTGAGQPQAGQSNTLSTGLSNMTLH